MNPDITPELLNDVQRAPADLCPLSILLALQAAAWRAEENDTPADLRGAQRVLAKRLREVAASLDTASQIRD